MHFIMIDRVIYNSLPRFYVSYKRLTKDNFLKETGRDSHLFDDINSAIERLKEIIYFMLARPLVYKLFDLRIRKEGYLYLI